jgi:putative endonuclease
MTNDIDRRLIEHNNHEQNTRTTLKLTDYKLIYCQIVNNRIEARKLEKYFKSGSGREIRNEIVQYNN